MLQIPASARQERYHAAALCLRRQAFARAIDALVGWLPAYKKAAPIAGRPECCEAS